MLVLRNFIVWFIKEGFWNKYGDIGEFRELYLYCGILVLYLKLVDGNLYLNLVLYLNLELVYLGLLEKLVLGGIMMVIFWFWYGVCFLYFE